MKQAVDFWGFSIWRYWRVLLPIGLSGYASKLLTDALHDTTYARVLAAVAVVVGIAIGVFWELKRHDAHD